MSSNRQDDEDMERPSTGGSIKRARERAEAGVPREDFATFARRMAEGPKQPQPPVQRVGPQPTLFEVVSKPQTGRRAAPEPVATGPSRMPRPQGPPGVQARKDGQVGVAISRPTPIPQWPLAGPMTGTADAADVEPYRPPPGSQPPQRPPRPSRVPSILDGSKIQDHTPVFAYEPQSGRDSELSVAPTTSSRQSTQSSVGSIPDFPLPISMPPPPPMPMPLPRRSVNLGPPPSSRRGASSFYSNASFVSPIPEESPRSRSHASFASSAAMPESWGSSPGQSPGYPEHMYYDDIPEEGRESVYDEEGDESRLVRSASIGKRGKAALVTTGVPPQLPRGMETGESSQRPGPSPVQGGPFPDGTGYLEGSSSSSTSAPVSRPAPAAAAPAGTAVTMDSILSAFDAASSTEPSNPSRRLSMSPQPFGGERPYNRWSILRKPPRIDVDNNKVNSRGSLTSLPDLIRRATQLAASLDKGRRPASRFDMLDSPRGRALDGRDGEKELSGMS
jgi:hypothetical protein